MTTSTAVKPCVELGLFTWVDVDGCEGVYTYQECTFVQDLEGVAKKGEIVDSICVDWEDRRVTVYNGGKRYILCAGIFLHSLEVEDDME